MRWRQIKNGAMCVALGLAAVVALAPLAAVLVHVVRQGWPALSWSFFTELPQPVGEVGGGMANAVVGTLTLVALASVVGVPLGIASGAFLAEYPSSRLGAWLRLAIDILASVPSIIVGLFAYAVVVVPMKGFSAHAGGVALAMILFPVVGRTTEEVLKLVPQHVREAGLALGIPRWKVIVRIVLLGSRSGIATGVVLAVARAAGETAPLLFTAFNNRYWARGLDQPTASLPVQIYTYSISPYESWHQQAWAGALTLVALVLALNLLTRVILSAGGAARKGAGA